MNKTVQFHFLFSREWVITRRGDGVLPVEWFANAIKERFSVRVVQIKTYECRGIIRLKSAEERENIFNSLIDLISDKYGIEYGSGVFDIMIEDVGGGGNMHDDPDSEWTILGDNDIKSLDRINNLVGADEFKKLAAECASAAPYLICNKILDSFASRA